MVAGAWVTGVALALNWNVPLAAGTSFLIASVALVAAFRIRGWSLLLPIALVFMLMAVLRVGLFPSPSVSYDSWLEVQDIEVEGVVESYPESMGTSVRFQLGVERINLGTGWRDAGGGVLVTARPPVEIVRERDAPFVRYGDRLRLKGVLEEAPVYPDFDYREYLDRQGVNALMTRPDMALLEEGQGNPALSLVHRLRGSLSRSLASTLPEPQASLAQALVLEIRDRVPDDVTGSFRDTGTSHLLAISGLHVAVVLGIVLTASAGLLGRRRNLYLLVPLGTIWLYAVLSGFSPSVERAAIMASLYLAAVALGRQRSAFPAIGFAASLMVALDPEILYDISFQLSFTAMAGILLMWRPLESLLVSLLERVVKPRGWRETMVHWTIASLAVSTAAVLATLPLLAFNFQRIAFLGIPATLLAMPAIPFLLMASLATAVLGLVAPLLGQPVGWIAWLPLSYLLGLVDILARLPKTVLHMETVPGLLVWAYYGAGLLILSSLRVWRRRESPSTVIRDALSSLGRRLSTVPFTPVMRSATMFSLAVGVVLLWSVNLSLADGRLYVTFIDVGQGDAVFIQTPQGYQVLVDGGWDPEKLLQTLGQRMPFWDRSLDLVVVSHSHEDHIGALSEVLRRYRVAAVLDNPYPFYSAARVEFLSLVEAEQPILLHAKQGQVIQLGEEVSMVVLNPPQPLMGGTLSDVDNNSTVVRLVYRDTSFLLTGDLGKQGELSLIDRGVDLDSSVLKVSHHGSQTSSTPEFLEKVNTKLVVVPVGGNNRFDHPSPRVMDLLEAATGSRDRVFTTADSGDITLVSDGKSITVRTER